jgi:osmotically-inducible protein OsmY
MTKPVILIVLLSLTLIGGCGGAEKKTVGLDVDLYLHPTSPDSSDVLLQAGIDRRLAEAEETKGSIIHVRVTGGVINLTGAVKSKTTKEKAEEIAMKTDVKLNGVSIWPDKKMNNQIDVQP